MKLGHAFTSTYSPHKNRTAFKKYGCQSSVDTCGWLPELEAKRLSMLLQSFLYRADGVSPGGGGLKLSGGGPEVASRDVGGGPAPDAPPSALLSGGGPSLVLVSGGGPLLVSGGPGGGAPASVTDARPAVSGGGGVKSGGGVIESGGGVVESGGGAVESPAGGWLAVSPVASRVGGGGAPGGASAAGESW